MNGYLKTTFRQANLARRALCAVLLCLLLSGMAQPAMAVTSKAQAATTNDTVVRIADSKPPGQTDNSPSTEENSEPDSGTLALLALGLIALGLARRKVRQ